MHKLIKVGPSSTCTRCIWHGLNMERKIQTDLGCFSPPRKKSKSKVTIKRIKKKMRDREKRCPDKGDVEWAKSRVS